MTQTNMPILYQNIMFGLPSEAACDVFLWAVERIENDPMLYKAEAFAHQVQMTVARVTPMLDAAARIHGRDSHDPDLMGFILKRHANQYFGGNVVPTYAGAA